MIQSGQLQLTTRSWLYRVILALDANFRLSNKSRSSEERDPNLTDGRAYMAPWEDYAEHLLNTNKELAEPVRYFAGPLLHIEIHGVSNYSRLARDSRRWSWLI